MAFVVFLCCAVPAWATPDVPVRFCSDDGKVIGFPLNARDIQYLILDGKPISGEQPSDVDEDDDGNFFVVYKGRKYKACGWILQFMSDETYTEDDIVRW